MKKNIKNKFFFFRIHAILCKSGEKMCKPSGAELPGDMDMGRVTNVGDIRMSNGGNQNMI